MLVLATLGAPERRRLGGRRPRPAEPEPEPAAVPTGRATIVDTTPVDAADAAGWLEGLSGEEAEDALQDALIVLNRAIDAHRLAAADPTVREVSLPQALIARLGHGAGEQVADGRWTAAREIPLQRRRRRRNTALRPQERLAALLGGRERRLACEELTLRARADLDAGRGREAALQVRVALEAGIAELGGAGAGSADLSERIGELRDQRADVGAAANEALAGELAQDTLGAVEHALGRLEAALRARAASI